MAFKQHQCNVLRHIFASVVTLVFFFSVLETSLAQKVRREDCGKVLNGQQVICQPAGTSSVPGSGTPFPPFNDIKRIVLVVNIPPKYKQAIDCHGKEDSCVHRAGMYGTPSFDEDTYVQTLKRNYDTLPAQLRTDNLVRVFSDLLNQNIMPWVQRDQSGNTPALVVIDRQPGFGDINIPGTLTVTIKLSVDGEFTPDIGVLSSHLYRFDKPTCSFDGGQGVIIPVPFELSEKAITERLLYFTQHLPISSPPPLNDNRQY